MKLQEWADIANSSRTWRERRHLRSLLRENPSILEEARELDNESLDHLLDRLHHHPFDSFEPRTDAIGVDEQAAFIDSTALVSIALGGNGSGKTYCGAQKLAQFLATTPPPQRDTPFWVIANSYEQVCQTCWQQKLSNIIPEEWVDRKRISWYKSTREWPFAVPLKPWVGDSGKNWIIEFKSYEQGRELMQAAAIGGAWFTEQFPFDIFTEVVRGCREHAFPGSIFAEMTPIDPEKSVELQASYEDWVAGDPKYKKWAFFRLNTESALGAGHVSKDWYEVFSATISEEMLQTRLSGAFASYEGAIYQNFAPRVHLFDGPVDPPPGAIHKRAIDWGASEEHAFVTLWGYKDGMGCWTIYDEYSSTSQLLTAIDHIEEIQQRNPWPSSNPSFRQTYADPSRPDQFSLFARLGLPIVPARNAVYDGIETVRKLLKIHPSLGQPMLRIHKERCPILAKQMTTYRWEKSSGRGVNPKSARPVPLKRNDDSVDALRYLLHTDAGDSGAGLRGHQMAQPARSYNRFKRLTRGR